MMYLVYCNVLFGLLCLKGYSCKNNMNMNV